ncbi:MAG: rod shape-determining protein MreD [Nitrospirae bacterium]|nr:rod shape-determining protein MreD [Nitrospirota bacterium]
MIAFVRWCVLLMFVFVLQVRVPLPIWFRPAFVLLVIFFHSLRFGETKGLLLGALGGLALDVFSAGMIGPQILSKGVVGYVSAWLPRLFYRKTPVTLTVCIAIAALIDCAILQTVFKAFSLSWTIEPRDVLGLTVATTAVGAVFSYMSWQRESRAGA